MRLTFYLVIGMGLGMVIGGTIGSILFGSDGTGPLALVGILLGGLFSWQRVKRGGAAAEK